MPKTSLRNARRMKLPYQKSLRRCSEHARAINDQFCQLSDENKRNYKSGSGRNLQHVEAIFKNLVIQGFLENASCFPPDSCFVGDLVFHSNITREKSNQ